MKSFAIASLAGLAAAYGQVDLKFMMHCNKYGLSWPTVEEFNFRKSLFISTEVFIEEHNASESSYKVGHNKFSTWTRDEMAKLRGLKTRPVDERPRTYWKPEKYTNQSGVNWTTAGCVTPVKDQGQCGSCWTFSATGALEGAHCVKSGGNLLSFAEQQLVDCCGSRYNCAGCNGGYQEQCYNYWETNFAMLESAYPYTATNGVC
jgi:cathepsin L